MCHCTALSPPVHCRGSACTVAARSECAAMIGTSTLAPVVLFGKAAQGHRAKLQDNGYFPTQPCVKHAGCVHYGVTASATRHTLSCYRPVYWLFTCRSLALMKSGKQQACGPHRAPFGLKVAAALTRQPPPAAAAASCSLLQSNRRR